MTPSGDACHSTAQYRNLIAHSTSQHQLCQVVDDVCAVWRSLDHTAGVAGHKRTGIANALDGSEDHLIRRQAKVCWNELGMSAIRDAEFKAVEAKVADGSLTWSREMLDSLVEQSPDEDIGVSLEGQEVEGSDSSDSDGDPWDLDDDGDGVSHDSDDDGGGKGKASAISASTVLDAVVAEAAHDPAELEELKVFSAKKDKLERMRQAAKESGFPSLQCHIERQLDQLEKEHHLGKGEKGPSAAMAQFVREKRKRDDEALHAAREEHMKLRKVQKEEASARAKLKAELARDAAESKKKKLALKKARKEFTAKDLGQGHKSGGLRKHLDNRIALLNRLKLRAPNLPLDMEVLWGDFVVAYASWIGRQSKAAVGAFLVKEVQGVMDMLGQFLLTEGGESQLGKIEGGWEGAFLEWIKKQRKKMPKASTIVVC